MDSEIKTVMPYYDLGLKTENVKMVLNHGSFDACSGNKATVK